MCVRARASEWARVREINVCLSHADADCVPVNHHDGWQREKRVIQNQLQDTLCHLQPVLMFHSDKRTLENFSQSSTVKSRRVFARVSEEQHVVITLQLFLCLSLHPKLLFESFSAPQHDKNTCQSSKRRVKLSLWNVWNARMFNLTTGREGVRSVGSLAAKSA